VQDEQLAGPPLRHAAVLLRCMSTLASSNLNQPRRPLLPPPARLFQGPTYACGFATWPTFGTRAAQWTWRFDFQQQYIGSGMLVRCCVLRWGGLSATVECSGFSGPIELLQTDWCAPPPPSLAWLQVPPLIAWSMLLGAIISWGLMWPLLAVSTHERLCAVSCCVTHCPTART
jgi:hypothetical protein